MTRRDYIDLVNDAIAEDSVKHFPDNQLYSVKIVSAGIWKMADDELERRKKMVAAEKSAKNSIEQPVVTAW